MIRGMQWRFTSWSSHIMRSHLVFALLLAACASGAPRQYAQGIPTAPRPPAFNPITDSPITVGQPGYAGPLEGVPRSPYGRVLPQTPETRREPGIWAAQPPQASDTDDSDPAVILTRAPLAPPDANIHETMRITQCALGTRDLLAHSMGNLSYEKSALTIKQLGQEGRCIVARVYRFCIGRVLDDEIQINLKRKQQDRPVLPSLERVDDLAQKFHNKECPFFDLPTAKQRMSERAERALNLTMTLFRNRYLRISEEGE